MKFLFIPLLILLAVSCNKSGDGAFEALEDELAVSSLEITPSAANIYVASTQQFVASGGKPPYAFSLFSGSGSVSASGLFTAPNTAGVSTVRVQDADGATRDALAVVEVEITLSPSTRKINVGSAFQFITSGGLPPYTYTVTAGSSTINSNGVFTAASSPEVATVRVTDSNSVFAESTVDVGNGPIISPVTLNMSTSTSYQLTRTSGTAPFTWSVVSGGSSGSVDSSGLFTSTATAGVTTVRVTDANNFYSEATVTVFVRNQIAASGNNTCILNGATNAVKCWGATLFGANGDGNSFIGDVESDMGENLGPVKLPSTVSAEPTIISSTYYNTCAIFDDGLTRCWGYNAHGQNGNNTIYSGLYHETADAYILPVPTDILNPIVDLARKGNSQYHQCGLYLDGSVKCWGYGANGALGQNGTGNLGSNYVALSLLTAPPINLGAGRTAVKVETGYYFTCVLLDDGNIKCWGRNNAGQLGLENTNTIGDEAGEVTATLPAPINFPANVQDIALGYEHTCVILAGGGVRCWGQNTYGQLGLGTAAGANAQWGNVGGEVPTALSDIDMGHVDPSNPVILLQAVKIDAGHNHTCALFQNAQMKCWGANGQGQLGQEDMLARGDGAGELGDNLPFINFGTGMSVVDIAVGGNTTCAKLHNGTSKCWGQNNYGQLGIALDHRLNQGDAVGEMGDALVTQNLGTTPTIVQMSPSNQTNCILMAENSINVIKCLGVGAEGALGIEDASIGDDVSEKGSNVLPVDLGTTKSIAEINAGINFNCARFTDGSAKCWGNNSSLVLGSNTLSGVYVGSGAYHMGANLSYIVPGPSVSILKLAGSKGGNYTSCAILTGNILKCWGYNAQGQLGQNSTTALSYIPTIPAISLGAGKTASDVSVGAYHTCAILNDGTVKCWGRNYIDASNIGVLGIGVSATAAPNIYYGDAGGDMAALPLVNLGASVTASQICSGHNHNCVITDTKKVKCWGINTSAQLGIGNILNMGDSAGEMGDALPFVNLGTGKTATKIACGANHTCAVLNDKKLKCWGLGSSGQLGYNSSTTVGVSASQMGDNLPAVNVGSGLDVLDVQAGETHTCALLTNNDVKCWGNNANGQLGQGSIVNLGDNIGEMSSLQSIDID